MKNTITLAEGEVVETPYVGSKPTALTTMLTLYIFYRYLFLAKDCVRYATPRVCKSLGCPVNSFLFAYFLFSVKRK